jgi:hypothetical protein
MLSPTNRPQQSVQSLFLLEDGKTDRLPARGAMRSFKNWRVSEKCLEICLEAVNGVLRYARGRDAYSTIRGYVYQVERTLRRWMDLGDNHAMFALRVGTQARNLSQPGRHSDSLPENSFTPFRIE